MKKLQIANIDYSEETEKAAERLAEILIKQIELLELNKKEHEK